MLDKLKALQAGAPTPDPEPAQDQEVKGPETVQPQPEKAPTNNFAGMPFIQLSKSNTKDGISDIAEKQAQVIIEYGPKIRMAKMKYALYLAPQIIESMDSVFTGPDFPYHVAWVHLTDRGIQGAASRGYRPVRMSDDAFKENIVIGEDALSMAIDRSSKMMTQYRATKTPLPAPLRDDLRQKWGFFLPPIVQPDGKIRLGNRELWFTERDSVTERVRQMRAMQPKDPVVTGGNFLREEAGGNVQRFEFDLG